MKTKEFAIGKLVHASALLGSSENVARMVVPRECLGRIVIGNAAVVELAATERLEFVSATLADMEGDATKNVLDGRTASAARRNVHATSIIHTNATKLMECAHVDLDIWDPLVPKNAAVTCMVGTATGNASAKKVSVAIISLVHASVIALLDSVERTALKSAALVHGVSAVSKCAVVPKEVLAIALLGLVNVDQERQDLLVKQSVLVLLGA